MFKKCKQDRNKFYSIVKIRCTMLLLNVREERRAESIDCMKRALKATINNGYTDCRHRDSRQVIMANTLLRSLQAMETTSSEPTARWTVPLTDGNHVVEFEHGSATGRRTVKIDGKTLIHRDWMFRLVGDEVVTFGDTKFIIRIDPISGLRFSYTLWVNGRSFKNFVQSQSKVLDSWVTSVRDEEYRVVLDKTVQTVWINGEQIDVENEFVDGGAEMLFMIGGVPAIIRSCSSEEKGGGIKYFLYVDGNEVMEKGLFSTDPQTS